MVYFTSKGVERMKNKFLNIAICGYGIITLLTSYIFVSVVLHTYIGRPSILGPVELYELVPSILLFFFVFFQLLITVGLYKRSKLAYKVSIILFILSVIGLICGEDILINVITAVSSILILINRSEFFEKNNEV